MGVDVGCVPDRRREKRISSKESSKVTEQDVPHEDVPHVMSLALLAHTFTASEEESVRFEMLDAIGTSGGLMINFLKVYEPLERGSRLLNGNFACATVRRLGTFVGVQSIDIDVELDGIKRDMRKYIDARGQHSSDRLCAVFRVWEPGALRLAVCFEGTRQGDLLYRILKEGPIEEAQSRPLFQGILQALVHIHEVGLVHRDIKAENVLLKADCPILADFGLTTRANSNSEELTRRCGSPGYAAPEVCLGKLYGPKVDVFGAGVVLYFMLSKHLPFTCPKGDAKEIMRQTVKCHLHLRRPPFEGATALLRSLLRGTICKDAGARLSSCAALHHQWARGHTECIERLDLPSG